jgi:CubicO group peptidase (beta-lactamase class C family)
MMKKAVAEEVFPGAVLLVGHRGRVIFHEAVGDAQRVPRRIRMTRETRFDLASLTKPLATTTAFMLLLHEGKIALDDPVGQWIPEFNQAPKKKVTVFHLLNHSSGLRAWRPYYKEFVKDRNRIGTEKARAAVYEMVHRERLTYPTGSRSLYSDLGFILAGEIVEKVSGLQLDLFCHDRIFKPLGLRMIRFHGATGKPAAARRYAATESCPWRKRVLIGEVHDDNAYVMGGAAGHAGLFGTALDVYRLTRQILASANGRDERFFPQKIVEPFVTRAGTPNSSWALGWDTPSAPSSSGRFFSPRSFGHLGFTGCSIWADRDRDLIVVLLTNRVHPTSRNVRIRAFRPAIHDRIMEELIG